MDLKNIEAKAKCIGIDNEGKGIIDIEGQKFSVPGLLYGEIATVQVTKKKNLISAKVLNIEEKSKDRVIAKCPHFKECGGCHLQHMSLNAQEKFKQKTVENLLGSFHSVNEILTMKEPYFYRNKIHSTVISQSGKIISGIYEANTHRVIPVTHCAIQDPRADKIIASILKIMKTYGMEPYDEDKRQGFLRHILIKTGYNSNQIMVVLVVSSQVFVGKNNFVKELLKRHPEITTIILNVNNQKTSAVLGDGEKVLYGKGYIEDTLCGCVFQISPKSFYQINPLQTEVLYRKAIEMAKLNGNETALDAYCGIGTITLIVSSKVKRVIGVEINKNAVNDAVRNAKINKISNVDFYKNDAGEFMASLAREKQQIDIVFMDPPRSGSDEKFLASLVNLSPKRVVYISCNPVTLKRDLIFLTRHGYKVNEIQPVDMFPHTFHVETVLLLERK